MRELNMAMKTPSRDVGRVRALTELAIAKGFRGDRIDEAKQFVAQKDALQRAKSYLRWVRFFGGIRARGGCTLTL